MNKKFPVLSVVSIILRGFGWLAVIIGLYCLTYYGLIEPNRAGHSFGPGNRTEILQGVILSFSGLIVAVFGEIIGVLFAIEENTRKAANK